MTQSVSVRRTVCSVKGQALIELTLITPLLLLLVFGTVEVSLIIGTYLDLTHLTREGANLTSRGTDPDTTLDAVIATAYPTIGQTNVGQWRIIYSKIVQDPAIPCPPLPCTYEVNSQITRGSLSEASKVGTTGQTVQIPGIDNISPNQTFHTIEVFYNYQPNVMTFVGENIDKIFYDRTIFTNVSGT